MREDDPTVDTCSLSNLRLEITWQCNPLCFNMRALATRRKNSHDLVWKNQENKNKLGINERNVVRWDFFRKSETTEKWKAVRKVSVRFGWRNFQLYPLWNFTRPSEDLHPCAHRTFRSLFEFSIGRKRGKNFWLPSVHSFPLEGAPFQKLENIFDSTDAHTLFSNGFLA